MLSSRALGIAPSECLFFCVGGEKCPVLRDWAERLMLLQLPTKTTTE